MSLDILDLNASVGEHQRDYLFKIDFVKTTLPDAIQTDYANVIENVDMWANDAPWPTRETNRITLNWSGEIIYFSGTDSSVKEGTITFRCDSRHNILGLWESLSDMTGTQTGYGMSGSTLNHGALIASQQHFDLQIAMWNVQKTGQNGVRQLYHTRAYGVTGINLAKDGSGILTFTVPISWDGVKRIAPENPIEDSGDYNAPGQYVFTPTPET